MLQYQESSGTRAVARSILRSSSLRNKASPDCLFPDGVAVGKSAHQHRTTSGVSLIVDAKLRTPVEEGQKLPFPSAAGVTIGSIRALESPLRIPSSLSIR